MAANKKIQFTELSLSQVSRINQTQVTGLDPDLIFDLGHEAAKLASHDVPSLLTISDKTVYAENSMIVIYTFPFSSELPLIGLGDNWTRSSALYSLSWDFVDLCR